jgi:hypothetical protein
VVALVLAAPIAASQPESGTGTGTIVAVLVTSTRQADGNVIQERVLHGVVAGTLTGTFVEHVRGVVHESGLVTFEGSMTFTGSVDGCGSGTVELGLTGRGVTGIPVTDAQIRVVDQADSTVSVHGVGTVHQIGSALTYESRFHCG